MADNVTITGTTIAADDISGVQYQRTKIVWGSDGTATDVSATNPLPVTGSLTVDSEFPAAAALGDANANPTTTAVGSHLLLFNGSTWDRVRGDTTNGVDVDVTRVQGTVTVDSELPAAAALADGSANPTVPSIGSFLNVYNGTTWDRVKGAKASVSSISSGAVHSASVRYNGTDFSVDNAASNVGDANSGAGSASRANLLFNGSNFDRARNNVEGALLASATRTTTTNTAIQTNYNARGVIIYVNVSGFASSETLTPKLYLDDPVSGSDFLVWQGSTLFTNGIFAYAFYPGVGTARAADVAADISATVSGINEDESTYTETVTGALDDAVITPVNNVTFTDAANLALPRSWWFQLEHSGSGNWIYSASYSYVL